jgi:hypothetical protein
MDRRRRDSHLLIGSRRQLLRRWLWATVGIVNQSALLSIEPVGLSIKTPQAQPII